MLKLSRKTIAHLTRRQWHMIKPVFIETALGDGDTLLGLSALNTRPNYYLIRIDSKWLDKENTDEIYYHLDDIYEAVEEQCGTRDYEDDDGNECLAEWPALNLNAGCSWWDATDRVQPKNKAAA